jgi:hypothetical protein
MENIRMIELRDDKSKSTISLMVNLNDKVIGVRIQFDEPRSITDFLNKRRLAQGVLGSGVISGSSAQPRVAIKTPLGMRPIGGRRVLASPPQSRPCKNCP